MFDRTGLSAKNTKMFDLHFSESDTESEQESNQFKINLNHKTRRQDSQRNQLKQQIASRSTKTSHQGEELINDPKCLVDLNMKSNIILKFGDIVSDQSLKKINNSSDFKPNEQKDDIGILMNVQFSGNQRNFSGNLRKFSGIKYQKMLNKKQRKKIQFLNNSNLMHDVEQIRIFNQTKTKSELNIDEKSVRKIKNRDDQRLKLENLFQIKLNEKSFEIKLNEKNQNRDTSNKSNQKQINDENQSQMGSSSQEENIFQNPECIFNSTGIKFKEIIYHDFEESEKEPPQTQNQSSEAVSSSEQSNEQEVEHLTLKKSQKLSLFSPRFRNQKYKEMRNNLLQLLLGKSNSMRSHLSRLEDYDQKIKKLLTTPIPQKNMFQFEVHVYKDLFKTQFQLWVKYDWQNEQETVLIAAAYNQSFHIDKSIFVIEQVNVLNQRQFIGQLESNFSRNFYSLFGYNSHRIEEDLKTHQVSQHQDTYIQQILNISLNIYRTVYIPNSNQDYLSFGSLKKNITEKATESLAERYQKQKFRQPNHKGTIMKLVTSRSFNLKEDFGYQNGLRISNKTLLIEDSQTNNQVLFIGKIASKKYKLMLGQPISPLQAFGLTIAHVESN